MKRFLIIVMLMLAGNTFSYAQKDSIILKNGDVITGTIKTMAKVILKVKTAYSSEDLKLKWNQIQDLYTNQYYRIVLVNGKEIFGRFVSNIRDNRVIFEMAHTSRVLYLNEILELNNYEAKFLDRVDGLIDFGYSYTRSKNLSQFTLRANLKYTAPSFRVFGYANTLASRQDGAPSTERYDGHVTYDRFTSERTFFRLKVNFLSNEQQQLQLRNVAATGVGYFFIRSNRIVWDIVGGIDYNRENYVPVEQKSRESVELMVSSEISVLDISDLDFTASVFAYPGLTYLGRMRVDLTFDVKLDLPLDFYVSAGTTLNLDSKPIKDAAIYDFIIQTSIGWDL